MRNLLLLDRCTDRGQHSLYIVQHVIVPKTHHTEAMLCQPPIAQRVESINRVLPAIDLNDEAALTADEIDHIRSDGLLANELESVEGA